MPDQFRNAIAYGPVDSTFNLSRSHILLVYLSIGWHLQHWLFDSSNLGPRDLVNSTPYIFSATDTQLEVKRCIGKVLVVLLPTIDDIAIVGVYSSIFFYPILC